MFQGEWECCKCGKAITELPFEPRSTDNLMCRECHAENRPPRRDNRERRTFKGNWKCSGCGASITELPFEPRDTSNLLCKDCYMKNK